MGVGREQERARELDFFSTVFLWLKLELFNSKLIIVLILLNPIRSNLVVSNLIEGFVSFVFFTHAFS